ncbi:DUF2497 domain-containing protein [Parvularcula dongshanensis]|uniref:DUF2497 domain-containing protein n=1 Tax=Parvularcula dongshanensis TaxID=1173995 RepID=A0A840I5D1_9PROT|nr:DUF2497 domain-containing protein [Parvularcula dongshanensis]MBB4659230.1 hypothetical protein [Parvularcula dongshanensis]
MASAQSEPSMDEILASIRRIISEEDDGAPDLPVSRRLETLSLREEAEVEPAPGPAARGKEAEAEAPQPAPEPEAEPDHTPEAEAQSEAEGESEALDDFDPMPEASPVAEASMEPAAVAHEQGATTDDTFDEAEEPEAEMEPAVRNIAEAMAPGVAASAVSKLSLSEASADKIASAFGALEENVRVSNGSGRTIEDLVEAMLQPMIQNWLDDNLPRIVEEKVEEEVRRLARRR